MRSINADAVLCSVPEFQISSAVFPVCCVGPVHNQTSVGDASLDNTQHLHVAICTNGIGLAAVLAAACAWQPRPVTRSTR